MMVLYYVLRVLLSFLRLSVTLHKVADGYLLYGMLCLQNTLKDRILIIMTLPG